VFTLNSHGLHNGDMVYLSTSGALPTGLAAATQYFVTAAATNTFQVSATLNGSSINTSGSQSGTHTLFYGSASVAVGDRRPKHRHSVGLVDPGHTHQITNYVTSVSGPAGNAVQASGNTNTGSNTTGVSIYAGPPQGNAVIDSPAYLTVNYIIKT